MRGFRRRGIGILELIGYTLVVAITWKLAPLIMVGMGIALVGAIGIAGAACASAVAIAACAIEAITSGSSRPSLPRR